MEFNLKQWRFQEQQKEDESAPAKLPRLFFDSQIKQEEEKTDYSVSPQLHLFVPTDVDDTNNEHQIRSTKLNSSSLFSYPSDHSTTRLPKNKEEMGGGGSYFSYGQWQELELQALIYRHMLAGAAIPPQLLQMVHKSLFNTSHPASNSLSSPYYVHPLQHYSHYHPARLFAAQIKHVNQLLVLQSGYWGRGAMDPEPSRCRRTDGKKWRCSRDVVGGQKYCERHVHRGRNRSRKPVELPASATSPSGTSSSIHPFHQAQRLSGPQAEIDNKNGNSKSGGQPLRHFFDDYSNRPSDGSASSTSLSISTPGNLTSDFSLKLATGNESVERERTQPGWGGGGPLAEALRSSRGSNISSTSVLNLVK